MSSELFFYGLKITAIGMGIVFVTLLFMQYLLKGISYALQSTAKAPAVSTEQPVAEFVAVAPPVTAPETAPQEINFGVLVAISAALSAMMQSRPVNIISIRKDIPTGSAWQQAARISNGEQRHN